MNRRQPNFYSHTRFVRSSPRLCPGQPIITRELSCRSYGGPVETRPTPSPSAANECEAMCILFRPPLGRDSTGEGPNNDAMNVFPCHVFPALSTSTSPRLDPCDAKIIIQRVQSCLPAKLVLFSFHLPISLSPHLLIFSSSPSFPSLPNTSRFVYPTTPSSFSVNGHEPHDHRTPRCLARYCNG
jgi:hypothetical protein